MAGKLRVHELAKELGVTSKELLATLKEQGEFVKTASSTVQPPVVKKMKKHYGVGEQSPAESAAGPKTSPQPTPQAGPKPAAKPGPKPAAKPGPKPGPKPVKNTNPVSYTHLRAHET